jgi:hypothetical protein
MWQPPLSFCTVLFWRVSTHFCSASDLTASVNNKLEGMQKEAAFFQHLLGGTEYTHDKSNTNTWCPPCPTSWFQIKKDIFREFLSACCGHTRIRHIITVHESWCGVALSLLDAASGILTCVRIASRDASRVVTPSPGEPSVVNISLACLPEVPSSVASSTSSRRNEMRRNTSRKVAHTFSVCTTCVQEGTSEYLC